LRPTQVAFGGDAGDALDTVSPGAATGVDFEGTQGLSERSRQWPAASSGREIVYVPAAAGDLIVWDSHLPHGNSKNLASRPRLAFYISMFPADGSSERERRASVESWRTARCVPWWRGRPRYDRVKPWPPAKLTLLGRRLLGIDPWP
jgi:hypothetical protein